MQDVDSPPRDRAARAAGKVNERRDVLADAALQTLSELGYARTGLRDIAANSPFSHGVVHYYFADKVELILHGVRRYKARCATRYDAIVATAPTAAALADGFATAMGATIEDEAQLHRLWYDLRSQSYFEAELQAEVIEIDALLRDMIWRVATRYFELLDRAPTVSPPVAYAMFDGTFQYALLRHLAGEPDAIAALRADVAALLDRLAA